MLDFKPKLSGDLPNCSKLYYNYEHETSQIISHWVDDSFKFSNIFAKNIFLAKKVVQHSQNLLPNIAKDDVFIHWINVTSKTGYKTVGQEVRNFFIGIWRNTCSVDRDSVEHKELKIMQFDEFEVDSPKKYFDENISVLLSKLIRNKILIALTIENDENLKEILEICSIIEQSKSSNNIKFTFLSNNKISSDAMRHIELSENSEAISMLKDECQQADNLEQKQFLARHGNGYSKIIHTLIRLNKGASKVVIEYIKKNIQNFDEDISELVKLSFVGKNDERIYLKEDGLSGYIANISNYQLDEFANIKPNGSTILSFNSPQFFDSCKDDIKCLESQCKTDFILIDAYATYLSSKIKGDNNIDLGMFNNIFSLENQAKFNQANEQQTKILLIYISQILISKKYRDLFNSNFFKNFEEVTYGFCNFLDSFERDEKSYESSRWITNLGYVYDSRDCKKRYIEAGSGQETISDRKEIYRGALEYLTKINSFNDPDYELKTKYTLAWQYLDSEMQKECIETFYQVGEKYLWHKYENNPMIAHKARKLFLYGYIVSILNNIDIAIEKNRYAMKFFTNTVFLSQKTNWAILSDKVTQIKKYSSKKILILLYFVRHTTYLQQYIYRRIC